MNRRDAIKAAGVAAAFWTTAPAAREIGHDDMQLTKLVELPLEPGDSVAAMTQFRGDLIIVTRHGCIFRASSMFE